MYCTVHAQQPARLVNVRPVRLVKVPENMQPQLPQPLHPVSQFSAPSALTGQRRVQHSRPWSVRHQDLGLVRYSRAQCCGHLVSPPLQPVGRRSPLPICRLRFSGTHRLLLPLGCTGTSASRAAACPVGHLSISGSGSRCWVATHRLAINPPSSPARRDRNLRLLSLQIDHSTRAKLLGANHLVRSLPFWTPDHRAL